MNGGMKTGRSDDFLAAEKADAPSSASSAPTWLELVARKVESLRFGVVQVIVYDSQVVQIERTERVRIAPGGRQPGRYNE